MKFWKCLSNLIEETLPDWREKFLSYKDLKKQLKMIFPKEEECSSRPNKRQKVNVGEEDSVTTKEVIDFVKLLEEEIHKFNVFFLDQQEEYIIRFEVILCYSSLIHLDSIAEICSTCSSLIYTYIYTHTRVFWCIYTSI